MLKYTVTWHSVGFVSSIYYRLGFKICSLLAGRSVMTEIPETVHIREQWSLVHKRKIMSVRKQMGKQLFHTSDILEVKESTDYTS